MDRSYDLCEPAGMPKKKPALKKPALKKPAKKPKKNIEREENLMEVALVNSISRRRP